MHSMVLISCFPEAAGQIISAAAVFYYPGKLFFWSFPATQVIFFHNILGISLEMQTLTI